MDQPVHLLDLRDTARLFVGVLLQHRPQRSFLGDNGGLFAAGGRERFALQTRLLETKNGLTVTFRRNETADPHG